jgi:hypothetical protein
VESFSTVRAAKEYLIRRILAQAVDDGVALSDIERKMLYFTEAGWTLPQMNDVSKEFGRQYDQDRYEAKISGLIRRLQETQDESAERDWISAVNLLRSEDHYILVMIDAASTIPAISPKPPARRPLLILTALLVVALALGAGFLANVWIQNARIAGIFAAAVLFAALGALLRLKVFRSDPR